MSKNTKKTTAKKASKKKATPEMATYRCKICTYEKKLEVGTRNVPCPVCRNTMAVKLFPKLETYVVGKGTTASGRPTVDIADATADDFREMDVEDVIAKTAEILDGIDDKMLSKKFVKGREAFSGTTEEFLTAKYVERDLNNGMIRMNCGNMVRNARKRIANA